MIGWNPNLYLTFAEQRTRPALDLAQRAKLLFGEVRPLRLLDLGCGPGNSTEVLASVFPGARIVGLDRSPDMIDAARRSGTDAEWIVADAAAWESDRRFDLIFSNAALQWIPDQEALLPKLWSYLEPGGALAIQVPGNGESPLHRALRRIAASPEWAPRFEALDDSLRYKEPPFYHDVLAPLGGAVDIWETTYWHVLENHDALIRWYSGTGMRPWLERLPDEAERLAFKSAILDAVRPEYPSIPGGGIFFPFRRIFVTAKAVNQ